MKKIAVYWSTESLKGGYRGAHYSKVQWRDDNLFDTEELAIAFVSELAAKEKGRLVIDGNKKSGTIYKYHNGCGSHLYFKLRGFTVKAGR